MIWATAPSLEAFNAFSKNTMVEHLGIQFIEFGDDYIKASMPVDHRTVQPFRLLHGGASCVLAETIGSVASTMCLDLSKNKAVGLEINANHLSAGHEGSTVIATARPVKIGRSIHVWNIGIHDDKNRLVCVSRLTMAVIPA